MVAARLQLVLISILWDQLCFSVSVVKVTNLHPVNPGSTPAGTDMSHCWQQEGHPTKIAPVF